jgi:hypothetical protein
MSQSNTREGDLQFVAGEDLTGKEGFVVKIHSVDGEPRMKVPTLANDRALYVLVEAGKEGELVSVRPMDGRRNVRLRLKGATSPGNVLVLADPGTAADRGMIRDLPNVVGTHRAVAVAEESGEDGQLVLCRPHVADYEISA